METKTKVCHMTIVHNAEDNRIFHKECTLLAMSGFDVTLITTGNASYQKNNVQLIGLSVDKNNRLKRMLINNFKLFKTALKVNAKIYHFHDPEIMPFALLLKILGKKVIMDSHEDTSKAILDKHWIPSVVRIPVSKIYNVLERLISKRFDAVIAGHPSIKQKYPESIKLYNYPDLNQFDFNCADIAETNGRFLWLGGMSKERGVDKLVELLKADDTIEIDLIGPMRGDFPSFKGLNNLGTFPVEVAYEKSTNYLAGLITFLPYPNNVNSSPNKLFEYMALKLPVIASNFSDWRKIVEGNNCGICVDPSDPAEIRNAMRYLQQNPGEARDMGLRGYECIKDKFNWQKEGQTLIDLYRSIDS